MKSIIAYSASSVYPLQVKEATLRRRYEDAEYAFIAGDLKLECAEAEDLYDAVVSGGRISVAVKDGSESLFRGLMKSDGTTYDPETELWSFPAVHQAKVIFEALKSRREWRPGDDNLIHAFDDLSTFATHVDGMYCNAEATETAFEFPSWYRWIAPYLDFLKKNLSYSTRDYMIDLAKHFRGIIYVDDDLPPTLRLVPRQSASASIGSFDDLIAEYSEEQRDAEYNGVFFPCRINGCIAFALYADGDVSHFIPNYSKTELDQLSVCRRVHFLAVRQSFDLPDKILDLRVPRAAYGDGMPDDYPFPFLSVPWFRADGYVWLQETPLEYCERHFKHLVSGSRELNVLYHDPVAVDPAQPITVRGENALITEVEDDLVNDTTRIWGRVAA